jgi:hypothetical protein
MLSALMQHNFLAALNVFILMFFCIPHECGMRRDESKEIHSTDAMRRRAESFANLKQMKNK